MHKNNEVAQISIQAKTTLLFEVLAKRREGLTLEMMKSDNELQEWDNKTAYFIQDYVNQAMKEGMEIEILAGILVKGLSLSQVIRLHNPDLTKFFLQLSRGVNEAGCGEEVVKRFDLRHVDVLLHYGPDDKSVADDCLSYIMSKITEYHAYEAGRTYMKGLFSWKIINGRNLVVLEDVLIGAEMKNIEIFLQYGFHKVVKDKCGLDLLASLYGNPNPDVLRFLKNEGIDVNGRGCTRGNSPLHYAAETGIVENIQYLLNEGANPDALNDCSFLKTDPLCIAVSEMEMVIEFHPKDTYSQKEKCVELLLQCSSNLLQRTSPTRTIVFQCVARNIVIMNRSFINTLKLFVAHVAIYDALKVPMEEVVLKFLQTIKKWDGDDLWSLYQQCQVQLRQLKIDKIGVTRKYKKMKFSMFTILTEDPKTIAPYVSAKNRQTIAAIMKKYNKENLHSLYYGTLEQRIKTITKLNLRVDAEIYNIYECNGTFKQHYPSMEKIANCFTFKGSLILKYRMFVGRLKSFFKGIKEISRIKIKSFMRTNFPENCRSSPEI